MKNLSISLLNDPEYAAASARLDELKLKLLDTQARIDAARDHGVVASAKERAQKMVTTGNLDVPPAVLDDRPTDTDLARLLDERHVLHEAVHLQRQLLEQAAIPASRKIALKLRPKYEAIMQRMAAAVHALAEVADDERDFREQLIQADLKFTSVIPPVVMPDEFSLRDSNGYGEHRALTWLREIHQDYGIKVS